MRKSKIEKLPNHRNQNGFETACLALFEGVVLFLSMIKRYYNT